MNTETVSYGALIHFLGVPRSIAMDSDGMSYEWACGCMAYRAVEDQYNVKWCDGHRSASVDGDPRGS